VFVREETVFILSRGEVCWREQWAGRWNLAPQL